jgi:NitT/TauT family transport system substrate-binding protein
MRTRYRFERRGIAAAGAGLVLAAVSGVRVPLAQPVDKVVFQTDWRAQAEHGGYYQAIANGIYRRHGIECELRPGGPQQNPAQLLLAGRVDMIMSTGFQAFNYVRENAPFLCIAAIMQKDPTILMSHQEAGLDGFEAMRGRPILVGAAGRATFWPFLRARFGFGDEQIRPYTFNLQPFLASKAAIMQGFLTSEPYSAMQAGATPRVHLVADAGYPNYQATLDVSRRMVAEKTDLVQRFVDATIEGWAQYLRGEDAAAANRIIMRDNPDMTEDRIAYAVNAMREQGIVLSGDARTLGIGAMTDARWERFYVGMRDAGVLPPGLDVKRAYSLQFVNRRGGLS